MLDCRTYTTGCRACVDTWQNVPWSKPLKEWIFHVFPIPKAPNAADGIEDDNR